jgi:hypothetical protein
MGKNGADELGKKNGVRGSGNFRSQGLFRKEFRLLSVEFLQNRKLLPALIVFPFIRFGKIQGQKDCFHREAPSYP